jgi:hypothetical protein
MTGAGVGRSGSPDPEADHVNALAPLLFDLPLSSAKRYGGTRSSLLGETSSG